MSPSGRPGERTPIDMPLQNLCGRIDALMPDAAERRARLERQLAMADEFLGLLRSR